MINKRMRKRGMFKALYLVMLTLLMCGLVLGFYITHQNKLKGALVSPLPVVEVRDGLEIFEMREEGLILKSLESVDFEAGLFEEEFVSGISDKMKEFISSDLFSGGRSLDKDDLRDGSFFEALYSVTEDDEGLVLKRAEIGKRIFLKADIADISFPVWFQFDFSAEYLIKKDRDKFIVERI